MVVDADRGTQARAFDHSGLSRALSSVTGVTYRALDLPFTDFEFVDSGRSIGFELDGRTYVCDVRGQSCAEGASEIWDRSRFAVTSPDGTTAAFIRDHNLWVRDLGTGDERPLTTDGVEDYGYATDNAGWTRSDRAVVLWSPDSRKIATFQQDQRGVGEMYLVDTKVGHPTPSGLEVPSPRRQHHPDDRARRDPPRRTACGAPGHAAGPGTVRPSAITSGVVGPGGQTSNGAPTAHSSRLPRHREITSARSFASRILRRARSGTSWKRPSRPSSSPATAW